METSWRVLEERGFVVVPGFLSADDKAALLADYEAAHDTDNANYDLKNVGPKVFARMRQKLNAIAAEVRAHTTTDVDLFQGGTYFANERTNLAWHQEFEPYYLCQDLHNYLNFYLPFVKEDPARSNLTVVPFDELRRRAPGAYERVIGRGAQAFTPAGAVTLVSDSTAGRRYQLAFDLDAIAVTPRLSCGDLLVVRGDVIHRTQDQDTRRIAASFRMARSTSVVSRERLAEGGFRKLQVMMRNRRTFECAFEHFAARGTDDSTVGELSKHLLAALPTYRPSVRALVGMLAHVAPRLHLQSILQRA